MKKVRKNIGHFIDNYMRKVRWSRIVYDLWNAFTVSCVFCILGMLWCPKEVLGDMSVVEAMERGELTNIYFSLFILVICLVVVAEILAVLLGAQPKWKFREPMKTYYALDEKSMRELLENKEGK